MRSPLTLWDISLWLAVTAIILLALTTTFATAAINENTTHKPTRLHQSR